MSDDKISNFDYLCCKADDFVRDSADVDWLVIRHREYLCISAFDVDDVPRFTVVIRVRQDMTVDVFKGIQCDSENTFLFPDMNTDNVLKASFSHLRKLYESEKDSLVKMAPGLSSRVLYPSNIERQNVKSVLKVFDEKTIAGLQLFGAQNKVDVTGTGKFLEIVLRLWKILNVKSTGKGLHKRDSDSDPIRSVDAINVGYLEQVHQWLIKWDSLNQKVRHGRLSNETMFALKHTVATFIELIAFLFTDIGVSYTDR
jgi:hypothetical protein